MKPWSINDRNVKHMISFYSATTGQEKHCLSPENLRILLKIVLQSASNKPVKPFLFYLL